MQSLAVETSSYGSVTKNVHYMNSCGFNGFDAELYTVYPRVVLLASGLNSATSNSHAIKIQLLIFFIVVQYLT